MAKKNICIRIPEEFLEKKPADLSMSDWIRECIHLWILEQEGIRKKLEQDIEKAVKKIEDIQVRVNSEEINQVVSKMRDIVWEINEALSQLEELERLKKELEGLKGQIKKSFICTVEKYSYGRDW
ncbi:MAG: hypothetical protein GXO22_07360 [Aquificae bacterium]|nr:hypothetical protein [Aquificota bacterium]